MVSEGEDWKSVEIPSASSDIAAPISNAVEESNESEQPSGGKSTIITYLYILKQISTHSFAIFF